MNTTELTPRVVVLSSTTADALRRTREQLADHLERRPITLPDVVMTLAKGREALPVRTALVADTVEELIERLRADNPGHAAVVADRANWTAIHSTVQHETPELDNWRAQVERGLAAAGVLPASSEQPRPGNHVARLLIDPSRAGVDIRVDEDAEPLLSVEGSAEQVLAECVARLWCLGAVVDPLLDARGVRRHLPAPAFSRMHGDLAESAADDGIERRPLTFLQQRLLFHDIIRQSSTSEHHVAAGWSLTAPVDETLLRAGCAELAERHPEMRTFFRQEPAGWRTCVRAAAQLSLEIVTADPDHPDERLLATIAAEPLTLVDVEPFRAVLVNRPNGSGLLVFVTHRAVTDGPNLVRLVEIVCGHGDGRAVGPIGMR